MKIWRNKFEWMGYANCLDDVRFVSESSSDDEQLETICDQCRVRPECIQWAVSDEVSSVFVAGVRLPDPAHKRALRAEHERLGRTYDAEVVARGEF